MKILAVTAVALIALPLAACSRKAPTTSSSASPSEVTFLKLPADATSVRYWDDWRDRIAVFETSEENFRAIFPTITFEEIRSERHYLVGGFGDIDHFPWEGGRMAVTTSGLFYEKIKANGGGTTILYDRATGTGYYNWGAW